MTEEYVDMNTLLDDEEDTGGFSDDGTDALVDDDSALNDMETLKGKVLRLVELREYRDITAKAAKNAKDAFDHYQADFFQEYERSPIKKGITVDLGEKYGDVQIVPKRTKFGRVIDRAKAEAYFKERNKEKEFIKEDFRMKRLNELVREHIEQGKPLPDGIDFYTTEYFSISFKD